MPRLKYGRELLDAAVRDSRSVSAVLVKLGLRLTGGGHAHVKRRLAYFKIDTSHFLGPREQRLPASRRPRQEAGPRASRAA